MEVGMMRKETSLKKTFNNAVKNTIKSFSKLEANDRYALMEAMGEWVFCDYDEMGIYLKIEFCLKSSINIQHV